jgi:ABC-type sugar transport system permease subunit
LILMKDRKLFRIRIKKEMEWYSFLIISIIVLIVLTYIPMLTTIKYSFFDARVLGYGGDFNGITNYKILMSNHSFLKSMSNTFVLAFLSLLQIPVGFLLAMLINSIGKGVTQSFYRVSYYLPNIITGVSVVLIFQVVLKQNGGLLNNIISALAGHTVTIGWLSNANYSHFGATILSVWQNLGYAMLINLASLQSIPSEIYEAAEVDGASGLKKCLYITIPNMKSCFSFLFITTMISGIARFTDLFIIGGNTATGRPGGSLQTLLMYIYQYSFEYPQYGIASAGAMILFVITFTVTLGNLKVTGFFKKKAD